MVKGYLVKRFPIGLEWMQWLRYAQDESSESSHFHSFTTDFAGKGEPLAIANPYYSLAYIMKL